MDEDVWRARAQTAEAKLVTMQEATASAIDRVKEFKGNFGIREKQGGEIVIDYEKFVKALGGPGALELRGVIDEQYNISGKPGKKPHMRLVNAKSD
jgi:hypothetical protein